MLDIKFIRTNSDAVKKAIKDKQVSLDLDQLLKVDNDLKLVRQELEELQMQRNSNAKEIKSAPKEEKQNYILRGKEIGQAISSIKEKVTPLEESFNDLMLLVPSIPDKDTPYGESDADNVVIKTVGEKPNFDFEALDHVDLLLKHGWADFQRIPNVSGSRNYSLINEGLMLEQAILQFAMNLLMEKGFDIMSVPSLVRENALVGTGHFPTGKDQVYYLPEDDLYLSGTAEVPINSLYRGEILDIDQLPLKIGGYSPCFRREAGSAGRDVRGLIRVHQFVKVEQFVLCENNAEESKKWHELMLSISEEILTKLELPYQVIECCTGDMGLGKFKMYDIESWVPSEEKYRETHSCSALHDWQARRTNLRYRDKEGNVHFCHTLNNTAVASPRILVPFLENHQTKDGRINLPEVLRPFFGGKEILGR